MSRPFRRRERLVVLAVMTGATGRERIHDKHPDVTLDLNTGTTSVG
jgi:hypothetical protein